MPWDGGGTFNLSDTLVNGTPNDANQVDSILQDIAGDGFGNCMPRDGEAAATGNQNFGGFRGTNFGDGLNSTDAVTVRQLGAQYATIASATAATIPVGFTYIMLAGYYSAGDGGAGMYLNYGSTPPSHNAKFQSANGIWWGLVPVNGIVFLRQFGLLGDFGVTDNTTFLNNALAYCSTMGVKQMVDGVGGGYYFSSKPSDWTSGLSFSGVGGKTTTAFFRNYAEANPVNGWMNVKTTGGCTFQHFNITATATSSGGVSVAISSTDANISPDFVTFFDVYLTSLAVNAWGGGVTFLADGSLRPALGLRSLKLIDCSIFGAANGAVFLKSVVGASLIECGCYQAGGTLGSMTISGTVGTPTSDIEILSSTVDDNLSLSFINQGSFHGVVAGNVSNDGTVFDFAGYGPVTGTINYSWNTSAWYLAEYATRPTPGANQSNCTRERLPNGQVRVRWRQAGITNALANYAIPGGALPGGSAPEIVTLTVDGGTTGITVNCNSATSSATNIQLVASTNGVVAWVVVYGL